MAVQAMEQLGAWFRQTAGNPGDKPMLPEEVESRLRAIAIKNPWFSREQVVASFQAWGQCLQPEAIRHWINAYPKLNEARPAKLIGVINAGNIPLVGLHDLLSVLLTGHAYLGKNASDDPYLLPWIAERLIEADPSLRSRIRFAERLQGMDAVIATGSDNSARYFEHYFGKYPHIIRKNRNGVAVLTGRETNAELSALGEDVFRYFGLGCRNVSKLYVPEEYGFDGFFAAQVGYAVVMGHNKYMNNVDYNNTVFLMKGLPYLSNNFLLVREDPAFASPIGVLHVERFKSLPSLGEQLSGHAEKLQCIVCSKESEEALKQATMVALPYVRFGNSQFPSLWDYADGVDTVKFLLGLD
jgi:hypothetical protein